MTALSISAEGCPGLCNSNGRCTLDQNGWHCVCQPGWRGAGCDVAMETLCADGKDNEGGEVTSDWLDIEIRILNGVHRTEMHMEMHMEISHKYLSMIIRSRKKTLVDTVKCAYESDLRKQLSGFDIVI